MYTAEAYFLARFEMGKLRTKKSFNLYNLIFDDQDFDLAFYSSDLLVQSSGRSVPNTYVAPLLCILSYVFIILFLIPPQDNML